MGIQNRLLLKRVKERSHISDSGILIIQVKSASHQLFLIPETFNILSINNYYETCESSWRIKGRIKSSWLERVENPHSEFSISAEIHLKAKMKRTISRRPNRCDPSWRWKGKCLTLLDLR